MRTVLSPAIACLLALALHAPASSAPATWVAENVELGSIKPNAIYSFGKLTFFCARVDGQDALFVIEGLKPKRVNWADGKALDAKSCMPLREHPQGQLPADTAYFAMEDKPYDVKTKVEGTSKLIEIKKGLATAIKNESGTEITGAPEFLPGSGCWVYFRTPAMGGFALACLKPGRLVAITGDDGKPVIRKDSAPRLTLHPDGSSVLTPELFGDKASYKVAGDKLTKVVVPAPEGVSDEIKFAFTKEGIVAAGKDSATSSQRVWFVSQGKVQPLKDDAGKEITGTTCNLLVCGGKALLACIVSDKAGKIAERKLYLVAGGVGKPVSWTGDEQMVSLSVDSKVDSPLLFNRVSGRKGRLTLFRLTDKGVVQLKTPEGAPVETKFLSTIETCGPSLFLMLDGDSGKQWGLVDGTVFRPLILPESVDAGWGTFSGPCGGHAVFTCSVKAGSDKPASTIMGRIEGASFVAFTDKDGVNLQVGSANTDCVYGVCGDKWERICRVTKK